MALTDRVLERDRPRLTFFLPLALTPPSSPGILPIRDFSNCKKNYTCTHNFRTKELTMNWYNSCYCCSLKYHFAVDFIFQNFHGNKEKAVNWDKKSLDHRVVIVLFAMKLSRAYVADNEWWSPLGAAEFGGRDVVTLPAGGGGGRPRMTNRRNGWLVVGFTVLSRVHLYKRPTEKTERQS